MYGTLALSQRALDDLRDSAGEAALAELRRLARPIEGLRVLNLSATGFGTGTAELLNSSVPLMNDLGLDMHWQVVRASEEAAQVGRSMYAALGGMPVQWTRDMTETWLKYAEMNAALLTEPFDAIIVHDPQPLAIRSYATTNASAAWLMHTHLDLSTAQEDVWMLLRSHLAHYDAAIFDAPAFVRADTPVPTHIVPPAIDPNSARNMPLDEDVIHTVLAQYGIDPSRPLLCHVSPCDAESDLCGVVDVWRKAREKHPDLQLVFVLTTEPHDPHGRSCYDDVARQCRDEASAFIVSAGEAVGNVELNVFQCAASVVLQKGLRKGFGLWVSDALWKERPCVVAPTGGLTEQVIDGETGIVASTTQEFADAVTKLLDNPELALRLGKAGRAHVADRFLITRYLRDYLLMLGEMHRSR
jgi:trehalose synthase